MSTKTNKRPKGPIKFETETNPDETVTVFSYGGEDFEMRKHWTPREAVDLLSTLEDASVSESMHIGLKNIFSEEDYEKILDLPLNLAQLEQISTYAMEIVFGKELPGNA